MKYSDDGDVQILENCLQYKNSSYIDLNDLLIFHS